MQNPQEAAYADMPLSALELDGSIDSVGTLDELAVKIQELAAAPAPEAA